MAATTRNFEKNYFASPKKTESTEREFDDALRMRRATVK
jgi:hypothetical protein